MISNKISPLHSTYRNITLSHITLQKTCRKTKLIQAFENKTSTGKGEDFVVRFQLSIFQLFFQAQVEADGLLEPLGILLTLLGPRNLRIPRTKAVHTFMVQGVRN